MADLQSVAMDGLLLLVLLIVIVRPLTIFLSNMFSRKTNFKERLFLASLAPRGIVAAAVTSIFALELEHASHDPKLKDIITPEIATQAQNLVPIVFIVIIGTVAFYGLLAAPLANRLGLAAKNARGVLFAGANNWARLLAKALHDDGHDVLMLDTNFSNVAAAKMAGIPATRAAPLDDNQHHTTAVSSMMRSRILFPGRPNSEQLSRLTSAGAGAKVKKTNISEQYNFAQFSLDNPSAIPLFLDSKDKGLRPATEDTKVVLPGTTIYALVPDETATPAPKCTET